MGLTNPARGNKIEIASGVMADGGIARFERGCPFHPLSFPKWVGINDRPIQLIPNNPIENRQRICVNRGASAFCCLTPWSAGQEVALGQYDKQRTRVELETVPFYRAGLRTGLKILWLNLLRSWKFGPNGRPFNPPETKLLVNRRGSIPRLLTKSGQALSVPPLTTLSC